MLATAAWTSPLKWIRIFYRIQRDAMYMFRSSCVYVLLKTSLRQFFTSRVYWYGNELYQKVCCTCKMVVLVVKIDLLLFWHSPCRCFRRSLLKLSLPWAPDLYHLSWRCLKRFYLTKGGPFAIPYVLNGYRSFQYLWRSDLKISCLPVSVRGTGSRFSACSFIKMLFFFFCRDMLYRLCKQYDHVILLSKNQSAHSPGSHLINLCANNYKLINHVIKPPGQQ